MTLSSIRQSIRRNLKKTARAESLDVPASGGLRLGRKGFSAKMICAANRNPQAAGAPSEIARACGIAITYERLPLAFGRVIYLAEASLQPPRITVNLTAIATLVEAAAQAPAEQRRWFTEAALTEVVIAHELYHILAQQPSSQAAEVRAHEFAQALTGLPFSPRVFEAVLKQATGCRTTKNII
jgi:hypothetical protein